MYTSSSRRVILSDASKPSYWTISTSSGYWNAVLLFRVKKPSFEDGSAYPTTHFFPMRARMPVTAQMERLTCTSIWYVLDFFRT